MIRQFVQRLPGGRGLAVMLVAAALALGGLSMSSIHAPSASAQCYYISCTSPYYTGYGTSGYPYGYNGYSYGYPYNSYYNNYYSGYTYPYNSGAYSYPYNAYSSYYPYNSYSSYGTYPYSSYGTYPYSSYGTYPYSSYGTSAYSYSNPYAPTYASTYTAPTSVYSTNSVAAAPGGPIYETSGSYCNVGSGQVWVPAGASPSAYGCTGSGSSS